MTPFLATGHGRSGTLWTSQFFACLGFPTLHEGQFSPHRHGPLEWNEVSWLAVPFLGDIDSSVPLLRVVRNPYQAVISGMQLTMQNEKMGTPFDQFLAEYGPEIVAPDDKLGRIIRWVTMWDAPIDDHPHRVIRPDTDIPEDLRRTVHYATGSDMSLHAVTRVKRQLGDRINARKRKVGVTRQQINRHPDGWRVRERAERFGYV